MTQALTYEEEQERLQQELDGEAIRIEAPKDPEVDPKFYRDVEPLLFRGFLTLAAEVNGVPFVFKSLNHHEWQMLKFMHGMRDEGPSRAFYDTFLAYGVFLVDGQNILPEREKHVAEIAKTFSDMPLAARKKLVRYMGEVNRRAAEAVTLTEAYATEMYSRFRWAQLRGIDLMQPTVTGIPGTERLGMNFGQLLWRALNHYADQKEMVEHEWENAKFIGSTMAGKGMSKVHSHDDRRRKKEREDRIARKDKILRQVILGEEEEKVVEGGAMKIVANSVEELASQLEKDLRGEKDFHDMVVEAEERRAREAVAERRQQLQAMAAEWDEKYSGRHLIGGTDAAGLTPAQVQERINQNRQLRAQAAANRMSVPEVEDPKAAEFHRKWGLVQEDAPGFEQTDRDPSGAIPIPMTRPRTPSRWDKR